MRTIIHDLSKKELKNIKFQKDDILISGLDCQKHCIGCFSCWIKHPKKCALRDDFSNIAEYIKDSEEFIIISESKYGCYSAPVKRVLERCIGYILPYFTIRNKEIHHVSRYKEKIKFKAYFYGNITKEDKTVSEALVKANAINLNAETYEVNYLRNQKELSKCIH